MVVGIVRTGELVLCIKIYRKNYNVGYDMCIEKSNSAAVSIEQLFLHQ